jgi:hypothetical protein
MWENPAKLCSTTVRLVWKRESLRVQPQGSRRPSSCHSGTQVKFMLKIKTSRPNFSYKVVCDVNDILVHDKGSNCNESRNTLNTLKPIWMYPKTQKEEREKRNPNAQKKKHPRCDNPCILSITRPTSRPWRGEDKPENLAISYGEIFCWWKRKGETVQKDRLWCLLRTVSNHLAPGMEVRRISGCFAFSNPRELWHHLLHPRR